jgi:hypothetical protein
MFDSKLTLETPDGNVSIEFDYAEYCQLNRFLTLIPRLCVGHGWIPGSFLTATDELEQWIETLQPNEGE